MGAYSSYIISKIKESNLYKYYEQIFIDKCLKKEIFIPQIYAAARSNLKLNKIQNLKNELNGFDIDSFPDWARTFPDFSYKNNLIDLFVVKMLGYGFNREQIEKMYVVHCNNCDAAFIKEFCFLYDTFSNYLNKYKNTIFQKTDGKDMFLRLTFLFDETASKITYRADSWFHFFSYLPDGFELKNEFSLFKKVFKRDLTPYLADFFVAYVWPVIVEPFINSGKALNLPLSTRNGITAGIRVLYAEIGRQELKRVFANTKNDKELQYFTPFCFDKADAETILGFISFICNNPNLSELRKRLNQDNCFFYKRDVTKYDYGVILCFDKNNTFTFLIPICMGDSNFTVKIFSVTSFNPFDERLLTELKTFIKRDLVPVPFNLLDT